LKKSQDYIKKSIHFFTNVWYLQKYPHILLLGNIVLIWEKTHQNEKEKNKKEYFVVIFIFSELFNQISRMLF
jgi:hypothetical protein